jgi:tetratricopeptide (TPR) repeat protein
MGDAAELIARGRRQLAAGNAVSAVEALERAAAALPRSADILCDLALARHRSGDPDGAVAACAEALALEPEHGPARLNLACVLRELDRLEECIVHADRAEATGMATGDQGLAADARFNRGLARLGLGLIAEGWADWEARLAQPIWTRFDPSRRWQGEPLAGRRLVVRREQGIGDELFFATCYPALLRRTSGPGGGPVVIECDIRLAGPLGRALPGAALHGIDTVAGRGAALAGRPTPPSAMRAPAGDLWVAAGSLPFLLGQPAFNQPPAPLMAPLAEPAARWKRRLAALPGSGPVVGLCWRTSMAAPRRDRLQARVEDLAAILRLPEIRPVVLQIAPRPEELARAAELAGRPLETFPELDLADDFEQALALVSALDLVVSVGTWIVPLAGMAGTPAWYLAALRDYWTLGTERVPWFAATRRYGASGGTFAAAAARLAADLARGAGR